MPDIREMGLIGVVIVLKFHFDVGTVPIDRRSEDINLTRNGRLQWPV